MRLLLGERFNLGLAGPRCLHCLLDISHSGVNFCLLRCQLGALCAGIFTECVHLGARISQLSQAALQMCELSVGCTIRMFAMRLCWQQPDVKAHRSLTVYAAVQEVTLLDTNGQRRCLLCSPLLTVLQRIAHLQKVNLVLQRTLLVRHDGARLVCSAAEVLRRNMLALRCSCMRCAQPCTQLCRQLSVGWGGGLRCTALARGR